MNPTERSWPLMKFSNLGPQGGVFTNNISLKILLQRSTLIVFHGAQPLLQISLLTHNLVVKSQANSFFVHAPDKKREEKFRFRVVSRFQFEEIQEVLSRFVIIVQSDKNSQQDIFCSQNSQLTFSQGSTCSHSTSQGTVPDIRSSPFSPFHSNSFGSDSKMPLTQPVGVSTSFESGMHLRDDYSFSLPPASNLYNQYSISPVSNGDWHAPICPQPGLYPATKLNPYASSYDQNTDSSNENMQKNSDDCPKFSVLKTLKPVIPAMIDRGCQTDKESFDNITSNQLASLIDGLTADKTFQIFVQRVSEAINNNKCPDQLASKSNHHKAKTLEPSLAKAPKLEVDDPSYVKDHTTDEGHDSISETLAKVDAILNRF